jgi:hypothetical protein
MALQRVKSDTPIIILNVFINTWYTEYRYNGCKPEVKRAILKWGIDGAGIGATAGG